MVNVGKLRREERFPLTTDLKTLKEKRDETRVTLRKVAPTAARGTFAADAARPPGRGGDADVQGAREAHRLAVIAYTGLPHALVKKLTPASINWQTGIITVPRRQKGKGVKTRELPPRLAGSKRSSDSPSSNAGASSAIRV